MASNVIISDGPIGYWPIDESSGTTAQDYSGNNNHGTYNGNINVGAGDGIAQGTLAPVWPNVNNAGDFVTLPISLDASNTSWAIEIAVYLQATDNQNILGCEGAPGFPARSFMRHQSNDSVRTDLEEDFPSATILFSGFSLATWTYLGLDFDGGGGTGTLRCYRDGALVNTINNFTPRITGGVYAIGGLNPNSPTFTFQGRLGQCAIFDKTLSAARFEAHYDSFFVQNFTDIAIQDAPTQVLGVASFDEVFDDANLFDDPSFETGLEVSGNRTAVQSTIP